MSDMWTPPSARSSQYPSQPTDGFDALFRKVEAIKTELRDATNGLLKAAGISVEPERVRFTGDVRIEGTLDLPEGIIGNEALANPVTFTGTWGEADNYAIPTSYTELVRATFIVPPGFTSMSFTVIASAQLGNTEAMSQYIYVRPRRLTNGVVTNAGSRQSKLFPSGAWDSMVAPYIFTDSIVPGDEIGFSLDAYAGTSPIAAHPSNLVRIEVSITLTR